VRILDGELLYRDFFAYLPPGGYWVVATWMKLFGPGFASIRVLALLLLATIAALTYAVTRRSSRTRPLAALLAIGWVVLSQGALTVINHHWFTTAASMACAVALLHAVTGAQRRAAAFAAGLCGGLAAMVTSTRGALLCLAVLGVLLASRVDPPRLLAAMVGVAIAPTAIVLHLASTRTLVPALGDVIQYQADHYSWIQPVFFGAGASLQDLALVALFPVAFVLAGATLLNTKLSAWRDPEFAASLSLAIVGLLGSYPRPDHIHISFTAPLACPLFALAVLDLRRAGRIAVSALFIGLCLVGLTQAITTAIKVGHSPTLMTARGPVKPDPGLPALDFAHLLSSIDGVPADRAFFFYPYSPLLPYLTARHHVGPIDVIVPGYTSPEHFRTVCARVATDAQWVVIDRRWSDPAFIRFVFPAIHDPDPPEKQHFEEALLAMFPEVVHASTRFELRTRSAPSSSRTCEGI
jgi:hypothetical protein